VPEKGQAEAAAEAAAAEFFVRPGIRKAAEAAGVAEVAAVAAIASIALFWRNRRRAAPLMTTPSLAFGETDRHRM